MNIFKSLNRKYISCLPLVAGFILSSPLMAAEVNIASPTADASVSGTVTISGTSNDIGSGRVSVSINGGAFQLAQGTANWSFQWDTSTVADGIHSITARARLNVSDTNPVTQTINVTVDNSGGLSVAITSPTSGTTVSGTISVVGISSMATTVSVQIDDGAFESANLTDDNWSYAWDTSTVADGSHTITARAGDSNPVTHTISVTVGEGGGPAIPAQRDPLVHWRMDEATGNVATDSGSLSYDGIISGASWTSGRARSALDFDGVTDEISIPGNGSAVPEEIAGLTTGTIAFWVKYEEALNGTRTPASLPILYFGQSDDSTPQNGLEVYIGNDQLADPAQRQLYFTVHQGGSVELSFDTGFTLDPGEWYHYAVAIAPGEHRGYINGVEFGRSYNNGTSINDDAFFDTVPQAFREILKIGYGRVSNGSFWRFNGAIDDVRIYNRALSSAEIDHIYDQRDHGVSGNLYFDSLYNHPPSPGILDGTQKTFLVTGYSTSHQPSGNAWPTILQTMLNQHADGADTYYVVRHTVSGTPIAKWTTLCGDGQHIQDAIERYINPGSSLPTGAPPATVMLAQQSTQWAFGDCSDRFMSIRSPADQERIDLGEAAIELYTNQFNAAGIERNYIATHIYKTPGYDLDLYGERYSLVEALDTVPNLYPGPELWDVSELLFPEGFASDLAHPGPKLANAMALYWYIVLAGDEAKPTVMQPVAEAAGVTIPSAGNISQPATPPTGVFLLGSAAIGTGALLNNYRKAIALEEDTGRDLFHGYVLRVGLDDLIVNPDDTSGPVQYDFSSLVNYIEEVQQETDGVREPGTTDPISLQVLTGRTVPVMLAQIPEDERYVSDPVNSPDAEQALPWAPSAVAFLEDMLTQLSTTMVRDHSQTGAPQVPLRNHPTLVSKIVFPLGLAGYRDNLPPEIKVADIPGYNRDDFVNGFMASMQAYSNAFPDDFLFLPFFGINDSESGDSLNTVINQALSAAYNGPGQTAMGVFKENLSDNGPNHSSDNILHTFEGHVLFQMLTSWISPFNQSNSSDREPKTASGSPAFGMMLGYRDFGSKYYETYISDLELTDEKITSRFAFLPPYGDAAGNGIVPTEDIPAIRATLLGYLEDWNRYLVKGPALGDDAASVSMAGQQVTLDVLANDEAPPVAPESREAPPTGTAQVRDPLVLTVTTVTRPANGTVTIAGDGLTVAYQPNAGFSGTDTFLYTVSDGVAGSATASVTIDVDSGTDTDKDGIPDAIDPDDDNDGMPDVFEQAHGFDQFLADADLNADGDRATNGEEFIAGTLPGDSSDFFKVDIARNNDGGIDVSFLARAASGIGYEGKQRYYTLLFSEDLETWNPVPGFERVAGQDQTVTNSVADPQGKKFFRASIQLEDS